MKLRDYQQTAIGNLRRSLAQGHSSPLLVAPCGSGKTLISAEIIRSALAKYRKVLFLAPRRELVFQTINTLANLGVLAGTIMAGEKRSLMADVQVASVATLHRRCVVSDMHAPQADLVIVDESHATFGQMARQVLALYPNASRVGMTATPARSDGRGLGELYDDLVLGPSLADLTAMGHLVPVRYFAPSKADLDGVRMQAGDYHQGDLAERMNKTQLIGDVVKNWRQICPDRKTVVFAVNRAHAMALHKAFTAAGVVSEYIDGKTDNDERAAILERVERGETQMICSVDVLTFGWDAPPVSCAIIARPTKSIARYLQAAGRVLRTYPGKTDAILIDHSGVVEDLGFLDEEQPWSLDGKEKIQERKAAKERSEPEPIVCPSCRSMFEPASKCPECGHDMSYQRAKAIKAHDAKLQEVRRDGAKTANRKWNNDEKRRFFGELKQIARDRGRSLGWASHSYRARLSVWPNAHKDAPPVPPSAETLSWVKHRDIAFAKRKE